MLRMAHARANDVTIRPAPWAQHHSAEQQRSDGSERAGARRVQRVPRHMRRQQLRLPSGGPLL